MNLRLVKETLLIVKKKSWKWKSEQVMNIVETMLDFNKQQKGEEIEILAAKQTIQRWIALVQVEAGNTYENLLNEISQIIHSLYREKEVTTKSYNNIINSIKL